MLSKEEDINRKIIIVKDILNNIYEILTIFKPLLNRMLKMDEAKDLRKNGTIEKAALLFGKISELCKEIESTSLPENLSLDNLGN